MRLIVSAGGTGGHIYPALAIINKFKEHESNLDILYIGTHNRMEKDIIPKNNIKYEALEIYGFSKKDIVRNIKNIFLIVKANKKCEDIMKSFKPDVVLGIGGYVTYPVINTAAKLGIKTFIHEQNSIAGKTNRALAKKATLIGVSFPGSLEYFPSDKTFVSGNPCQENALTIAPMPKEKIGLSKDKKLVVVVAGSLGSETLNNKMKDVIKNIENKDYELLYITGANLYESFTKDLKIPNNVKVLPFLDNLSSLLKNTDLIVTRAGASTMSEIIALKLPAIFIPSPYVANNHQYYNALELKSKKASDLIEEKDLNSEKLIKMIDDILNDTKKYNTMKENLNNLGINNSSELIYQKIKDLVK